ncbi:MAG: FtsX-like permease family protein [Planctomycetota bacterium]
MYQALLTRRYLTSKVMPLLASAAVMLCVAMELITWSVMGGFLNQLIASGRSLIGDVEISRPQSGFPYYDELIARLEADDLIVAASPTVDAYGLISLGEGQTSFCNVKGIEPESFDAVTGFRESIYWKPIEEPLPKDDGRVDPRLSESNEDVYRQLQTFGETLEPPERADLPPTPLTVLGLEVFSKRGLRTDTGILERDVLTQRELTVNVLPTDRSGGWLEPVARRFVVANEFASGVFEIDSRTLYVRLDELQDMLRLDEAERVEQGGVLEPIIDPETGEVTGFGSPESVGIDPARATSVLVRGADGADIDELRERVDAIYSVFANETEGVPPAAFVNVLTWEDRNATLIGAIKKETALVLFIFGIISLTSVFLVLAIFWSMVSERTKDVGILRAIGASRLGVAWLWIRYGLAIGAVGTAMGVGLAFVVITNINAIHDWMGSALGMTIWDPAVYYFTTIPEDFDAAKVAIVSAAGVLSCVIGAVVPAARAARMDPVRALRFE